MNCNAETVEILNREHLNKTLASNELTVLVFWTDWCGPCKKQLVINKTVDEKFDPKENNNQLCFAECNADLLKDIAAAYQISAVPTMLFIKNNEIQEKKVGIVSENDLFNLIIRILLK